MAKKRSNEVAETLSGRDTKREATMLRALPAECRELVDKAVLDTGKPFEPSAVAMLKKLRGDDLAAWQRTRALLGEKAKVSVTALDAATAPAGDANGDGKPGRPVEFKDSEPWDVPVEGAALLDDLVALLERYVSLPKGGAVAVALWTLYTWSFRAFPVSPNLMITAPERGSGKTQLTDLISWMVPRPFPVSDTTASAIFRIIEHEAPTLLFDEAQGILKRGNPDDPTKTILLGSFSKRFANVPRTNKDTGEVRMFSTFAPKVLNGLKLAPIILAFTSRCIVVPMTRATRAYPELRDDRDPVGEDIRRQCARWRDDHQSALREADPEMRGRIGRIAQVWRPLLAIADAVGGEWPEKARAAADVLAAFSGTFADGETLGTMLLADVRAVFKARGNPERIKSDDLDDALRDLPERPWESMPKTNKPITREARGRMLRAYGINTKTLRFDGGRDAKGYERAWFADAWSSWLSEGGGNQPVDPLTCLETRDFSDPQPVDGDRGVNGSESAEIPAKQGVSTGQRVGNRGARREDATATVEMPSQPPGTKTAGEEYRRRRDGE